MVLYAMIVVMYLIVTSCFEQPQIINAKDKQMKTAINNQPKELGKVSWFRNYDKAVAESNRTGKPIFLLFQEVPGCSNCVNFGHDLLSYPLFVEAIENEFVPLAIYNNAEGEDRRILNKFNEQAWNNPVVRFIDKDGGDLVPKLEFSLDPFLLHEKMEKVILLNNKQVPLYFELLKDELKILYGTSKITYYETPCFWSGETSMIQNHMVLTTEAGWIGHKEVVKIHYDPAKGSLKELDNYAIHQGFYLINNPDKYKKDVNPQYYLKGSVFGLLPLSFVQRSVLNYTIPYKKDVASEKYLSPLQYELLLKYRKNSDKGIVLYNQKIEEVWPFSQSGKPNTN